MKETHQHPLSEHKSTRVPSCFAPPDHAERTQTSATQCIIHLRYENCLEIALGRQLFKLSLQTGTFRLCPVRDLYDSRCSFSEEA